MVKPLILCSTQLSGLIRSGCWTSLASLSCCVCPGVGDNAGLGGGMEAWIVGEVRRGGGRRLGR